MRSELVKGVLATTLGAGLVAGVIMARPAIAQDNMPDGPGKAETVAACSGCHGLGQIQGEHRSADVWATTVTAMINNGAPVADSDFDKIVNYLATNFGPEGQAPAAPPAAAAPAAPAEGAAPPPAAPATPPAEGAAPATPPADAGVAPTPGTTMPPAGGTAPASPPQAPVVTPNPAQ